ncbi:META domain-containing protein, partial [Acinetobacter baumannii]|uniref:META domain-containing protein n=1 Tax=Acinetobacter baumannii TaxID=470 RepID=UPI003F65C74A
MKIKYLILALLPFSLMACQTVSNTQAPIVSEQQQNLATTLSEYAWTYQNVKASKPLILNFNADGKLAINTGCNGQGGTWKVEGNQLVTSPLASTMMGEFKHEVRQFQKPYDNQQAEQISLM